MKFSKYKDQLKETANRKLLKRAAELTSYDPLVFQRHIEGNEKQKRILAKVEEVNFDYARLNKTDVSALEAIVYVTGRPVFFIDHDEVDLSTADGGQWPDRIQQNEDVIRNSIPSVGRVEIIQGIDPFGEDRKESMLGSCFSIAENLVLTNHHVAELFMESSGEIRDGLKVVVDFVEEYRRDPDREFRVRRVLTSDRELDFAVLEIEPNGKMPAPLPLETSPEEAGLGDLTSPSLHPHVFLLGYPAFDRNNDPELQEKLFDGVFEVKRFSPGRIRRGRSANGRILSLYGDYTSLPGSSGSPVIHFETGRVVGLHHAGLAGKRNYSIPIWEIVAKIKKTLGYSVAESRRGPDAIGRLPQRAIDDFSRTANHLSLPKDPPPISWPHYPPQWPYPTFPPKNPWPWIWPSPPLPWPWNGDFGSLGTIDLPTNERRGATGRRQVVATILRLMRNLRGAYPIDQNTSVEEADLNRVFLAQDINDEFFPYHGGINHRNIEGADTAITLAQKVLNLST